jgi:archaellin
MKKGISPIVAIALILVIAIFAIVSFQTWYINFQTGVFTNVETGSKINEGIKIDKLIGDILYVKSKNEESVEIKQVKVGTNECNCSTNTINYGMNDIKLSGCIDEESKNQDVVLITDDTIDSKTFYNDDIILTESNETQTQPNINSTIYFDTTNSCLSFENTQDSISLIYWNASDNYTDCSLVTPTQTLTNLGTENFHYIFLDASDLSNLGTYKIRCTLSNSTIYENEINFSLSSFDNILKGGSGGRNGDDTYVSPAGISFYWTEPTYNSNGYYWFEFLFDEEYTESYTNYWLTNSPNIPVNLTIDFFSDYNISNILVYPGRSGSRSDIRISTSENNITFTNITDWFSTSTLDVGTYENFSVQNSRYYLLELSSSGLGASLNELKFYTGCNEKGNLTATRYSLSGGSGGSGGQYVYTAPDGTTVTSTAPTYNSGSNYWIEYLFDDEERYDITTDYWLTNSNGNQNLTFDFGEIKNFDSVYINAESRPESWSDYKLYNSLDGISWTNFTGFIDSTVYGKNIIAFPDTRYFRIELTRENIYGVTLNEIAFFTIE